jgi:hypothetical protein
MKKKIILLCLVYIVLLSSCTLGKEDLTIENSVTPYTADYIPFENVKFRVSAEELAASFGISKPRMINYSMFGKVRYKTFNRTFSGSEYGGGFTESYFFDINTGELVYVFTTMEFKAPLQFAQSEDGHRQVLDKGLVYVREFYDRLCETYKNKFGIVLDAASDGISADYSGIDRFSSGGSNGNEESHVSIWFVNDPTNDRESLVAQKSGLYGYCAFQIMIKVCEDLEISEWSYDSWSQSRN